MTETAIQHEMQTMSDQTLNKALRGRGGPQINPHQESLIQDELDQRRLDQEYAAQMAMEANQNISDYTNIDTGQAVDTLQEPGFEPLSGSVPLQEEYIEDSVGYKHDSLSQSNHSLGEPSPNNQGPSNTSNPAATISESEIEALLFIGALLYEAALIELTEGTIQAQINKATEFYITDSTLPKQITELLWKEYDRDERIPYLKPILGNDTTAAIDTIETLIQEVT